jgi:hypothetical protein
MITAGLIGFSKVFIDNTTKKVPGLFKDLKN